MAWTLARNLCLGNLVYGCWHHLMYVKLAVPLAEKFNPKLPQESQHARDRLWTNSGFVIGSLCE